VLLDTPRALGEFSLLDHQGRPFDRSSLRGQWNLVAYGFTSCPDVCPTTLADLDRFLRALGAEGARDLQVLFYTVDHRRDTVQKMASYVSYFNAGFIGLTHLDEPSSRHRPFERDLGISARLVPREQAGQFSYDVLHGVNLLLLNPDAELQAVFRPGEVAPGVRRFAVEQLVKDYLAVRNYLQSSAG
jgi:protein SCO1/2